MSRNREQETDTLEAPESRERRFVYGPGQPGGGSQDYLTRGNRPVKRRRKSPFKIVSLLVAISALTVFYVWNKISVNRLTVEVHDLEKKLETIRSMNGYLQSDVDRKGSLENITGIALTKLNMQRAPEPPVFFEVDDYEAVPTDAGGR